MQDVINENNPPLLPDNSTCPKHHSECCNEEDDGLVFDVIKRMPVRLRRSGTRNFSVLMCNAEQVNFRGRSEDLSSEVFIQRENNLDQFRSSTKKEKSAQGSTFGEEARKLAQLQKRGTAPSNYRVEDQPWLLAVGKGRSAKRYRCVKEANIGAHSTYFIFSQSSDGVFDAYPVNDWYAVRPQISYRHLRDEEAETEFQRRNKVLNHFSIMKNWRQTNEAPMEFDNSEEVTKAPKKGLLITELDDWEAYNSGDEDDGCSDDAADKSCVIGPEARRMQRRLADKKKRSLEIVAHKRRSTKSRALSRFKSNLAFGSDEEDCIYAIAEDESDADDHAGDEIDYMTDSSSDEEKLCDEEREQIYQVVGVEEEAGLRALLTDGSDPEDEQVKFKADEGELFEEDHNVQVESADTKDHLVNISASATHSDSPSSASSLSSSSTSDVDEEENGNTKEGIKTITNSGLQQPIFNTQYLKSTKKRADSAQSLKRLLQVPLATTAPPAKRFKSTPDENVFKTRKIPEDPLAEAVMKYLLRKPITMVDLLKKLTTKHLLPQSDHSLNSSSPSESGRVETKVAEIFRQLKPLREDINGKIYFSLKP
ncbi:hypothetical protein Aperf_G00000096266 [Anoplocephala perfoliata]